MGRDKVQHYPEESSSDASKERGGAKEEKKEEKKVEETPKEDPAAKKKLKRFHEHARASSDGQNIVRGWELGLHVHQRQF